jgi:hypothetical protein
MPVWEAAHPVTLIITIIMDIVVVCCAVQFAASHVAALTSLLCIVMLLYRWQLLTVLH